MPESPFSVNPGYCAEEGWARLIENVYGYKTYPIAITRGNTILAFTALTHIKHPVFGSYLVSAPYSSYGGVWYADTQSAEELIHLVKKITLDLKARYAVLRFRGSVREPLTGMVASPLYRTYRLDLNTDSGAHLNRLSPNHRNHIRKSFKKGFSIRIGGIEILDDAYIGLSRSMRELGSPYHAKNYLSTMNNSLPNQVDIAVVYLNSDIVGAGVFIRHENEVVNLHANILRKFRSLYAGEFFYWSMIEHYRSKGCTTFDLGRSLIGSGNEVFKTKWEPEIEPLNYWYYLPNGGDIPELNQKSPKFQIAIAVWKRLPQFVVNAVGPMIIKGIA